MEIRKIEEKEMQNAVNLSLKVFLEYEAPDYSEEGVREFEKTINDKEWILEKEIIGAFENNRLIGLIAIKNYNHIALFFVDSDYQGKGIGKKLFQEICKLNNCGYYTVNSSPYAKSIYEHLGFKCTSEEKCVNGMRFYPMINDKIFEYKINKKINLK
ncbi:MAG: GNAT family N-acetyltransferase [Clostridia bacterium]|nr:GNAT family N-acetyltransferase [Clostridia bacterium]